MARHRHVKTLQPYGNLDAEEAYRVRLEATKTQRVERVEQAFAEARKDGPEDPKADEIRAFLVLVVKNLDAYPTRVRVQNPSTSETVEMDWLELCGATIRELSVGLRLRRLTYECVASMLPPRDDLSRQKLADAASIGAARRVSPKTLDVFKKQGVVAAFVAKLFLDSKSLMFDADAERARSYFVKARARAEMLQGHLYLTGGDHRFLKTWKEKHGGALVDLVERQTSAVIKEIEERGSESPVAEHALLGLIRADFEAEEVQDMDAWWEEVRAEFTPEMYVYTMLDEFRSALGIRMKALQGQPVARPEHTIQASGRRISELISDLDGRTREKTDGLLSEDSGEIDLFQVLRQNASVLSDPGLAEAFTRFITDPRLIDVYAQYSMARFKKDEPSLRAKINGALTILDEIYRSAPLSNEQQEQVDVLGKELSTYVEKLNRKVPPKPSKRPWIIPFAREIFVLLNDEEQFKWFTAWLEKVRAILNQPPEELDPGALEELRMDTTRVGVASLTPHKVSTDEWAPTLSDATVLDENGRVVLKRHLTRPVEMHSIRPVRSGVGAWRGWPWNWFRKT